MGIYSHGWRVMKRVSWEDNYTLDLYDQGALMGSIDPITATLRAKGSVRMRLPNNFKDWLHPTPDEVILFELETGYEYPSVELLTDMTLKNRRNEGCG